MTKIFRCTTCLNTSNRPRIEFDEKGRCNACVWTEEKRTKVDWVKRQQKLKGLVE